MNSWISHYGYRLIVVDKKLVPEHRHIMEQHIGRKLSSKEHVHHKDGNKLNNDICNLEVINIREHGRIEGLKARGVPKPSARKENHKICKYCLKDFIVLYGQVNRAQFCSKYCANTFSRGRPKPRKKK